MRVIALIAALSMGQSGVAQRSGNTLPPGTSAIGGVVVDVLSKLPVKGCRVTLGHLVNSRLARSSVTISGADGRFVFSDIADGEYAASVSCDGYLTAACYRNPDSAPPRCDNISVAVDQRRSNINFNLMPEAIARGKVVDPDGRPIAKATVRLGVPRRDEILTMTRPTETARDGSFELSGLPAGEWRLEVEMPAANDAPRPPIIYFPGVLVEADAGWIELAAGKALENVVVVAPALDDHRLTVRLVTLEPTLAKVDLALVRMEPLMSRRLAVDDTATATATGLVPGRYLLSARAYSEERLSVAFDVVDFLGNSQETLLYMQPPARIAGRIIGERGEAPSLDGVRVGAVWIHDGVEVNPTSVDEAAVAEDGTFRFDGLFGTRQLRLFGLDPDFEVQSISEGRTDVTDSGVALTADTEVNVVIVVGRR